MEVFITFIWILIYTTYNLINRFVLLGFYIIVIGYLLGIVDMNINLEVINN